MLDIHFRESIANDEVAARPALRFEGEIVVVDTPDKIDAACEELSHHSIIGFDTETRPSFKAGVINKVSLLQLSTPTRCYLFRINKIPLARPILKILESDKIIKVGADVAGDMRSLRVLRHFKERGFIDLQHIVGEWNILDRSLRKMSAIVLGQKVSKAQRLSKREAVSLTEQQQHYAATDAWCCIEIYNRLQSISKPKRVANDSTTIS